jgi:hypothetical protein
MWHFIWFGIYQGSMWVIYHLEWPFFERYKISKEPWPWNENKEEWKKKVVESLKL